MRCAYTTQGPDPEESFDLARIFSRWFRVFSTIAASAYWPLLVILHKPEPRLRSPGGCTRTFRSLDFVSHQRIELGELTEADEFLCQCCDDQFPTPKTEGMKTHQIRFGDWAKSSEGL